MTNEGLHRLRQSDAKKLKLEALAYYTALYWRLYGQSPTPDEIVALMWLELAGLRKKVEKYGQDQK